MIIQISTIEQLATLAEKITPALRSHTGISLGLVGTLGAGKTTFSSILVKALGSKDAVSSPSFVLQHEYALPSRETIEHWDLYRLTQLPEELYEPTAADRIRLVEWPDKFPEYFSSLELVFKFNLNEDMTRTLEITDKQGILNGVFKT